MKKILLILAGFLLVGGSAFAATNTTATTTDHLNRYYRGYGNSFIFVEQGIEFAIFPDGQFDFNVNQYAPNFGAYANFGGVSISFNTGYSYDAYVQYDDFGAVIQIENVPIYYDYYGRIIQAGNVHITYNNFGRVYRVGGLFVHYNRFNRFSHCTGFINVFNRHYVYRPWHNYYVIPSVNFCILFDRPYRRYYRAVRHHYYRPYRDNFRPRANVSYNAGRRGAVAQNNRRSDRYRQERTVSRRDDRVASADRVGRDGNLRGAPANSTRPASRVDRTDKVRPNRDGKTKPVVRPKNGQSNKVKPRGNTNQTRPKVDRNSSKKRRVASQNKPQSRPKLNKRVSTKNNRKTNSISQRSKKSSPKMTQRSSSKSNNKTRVSRSSSQKQRSATKRRRQ